MGSGHCNIAFLPGLANYPTDTVRINSMTAYYKGKPNYTFMVMPPGQVRPDGVAGRRADVLHSEQEHQRVRDVRRPDGGRGDDRDEAGRGYTPGKNIAGHRVRRREGDRRPRSRPARCSPRSPCTRRPSRTIGIKYLDDALKGQTIPNLVNIIDKNHPLIITPATLEIDQGFKPDWSLTGDPG